MRLRLRKSRSKSRAEQPTSAESPGKRSAIQIVVTPGSGAGLALLTARRLSTLLRRQGRESRLRKFRQLAALRRWAETCEADFSHLICVGGDATMSTAAHAAIRLNIPFLAVPQGFGNVFASTFHYPDRPEAVLSLLEHGHVRRVDVGRARKDELTEICPTAATGCSSRSRMRPSTAASSHAVVCCATSGTTASHTSSCFEGD